MRFFRRKVAIPALLLAISAIVIPVLKVTSAGLDTTPPVISAVSATGITTTTATIIWATDEPATGMVEYGLDTTYGTGTPPDLDLATTHVVSLSELSANTYYHYRVKSKDACENEAVSTDYSFATPAAMAGTPPGSNVTVSLGNMTVTFDTVTAAGATSVVTMIGNPAGPTPAGFRVAMGLFVDITTTATHSGPIVVGIGYGEAHIGNESNLRLFHWDGTQWEDVTTSVDAVNNVVYGQVNSLSPFFVGEQATLIACGADGHERNQFAPGESVYVKASGLDGNTGYAVWIQPEPMTESQALDTTLDPSGAQELVTILPDGGLGATLIWQIPANTAATYREWEIVFDRQDDGDNTGKYNLASDVIHSISEAAFVAPTPEAPTILLFGTGLVFLAGYLGLQTVRSRMGRSP